MQPLLSRSSGRGLLSASTTYGVAIVCLCSPFCLAHADERRDNHDLTVLIREQKAKKATAEEMLGAYDEFVQKHPDLDPDVAVIIETNRADLLSNGLKKPEEAMAVLDKALATYSQPDSKVSDGSVLRLVRFKSTMLVQQKNWKEVAVLLDDSWPRVLKVGGEQGAGSPRDVGTLIHQYIWSLPTAGKESKITPVLVQTLSEIPAFLSGEGQSRDGSFYDELVARLLAEGRKDEALSWAKLQYVMCSFDKDALDRSTKLLGRAWAGSDDFAAVAAFAKAQSDASAPNPLAAIKLPALSPTALKSAAKALEGPPRKENEAAATHALITLDLANNDFDAAMRKARALLQNRLDSPEGAAEVARVFKAADLNLVGANGFLLFLKGEGTSPFPAFFAKYGKNGATPAN